MTYLENYLAKFIDQGHIEQANSIRETATEIGNKYLKNFNFNSNQIGLLFGNIQSGKTAQMFGIASEAADSGFPFFILLETDNTLLQQQTYERAKRDLPNFVICDENEEKKFRDHGDSPVMVVIKKNSRILKAWMNRFKNSKVFMGNPLFILDDEADASSLNTKVNQQQQSTINFCLEEIRNTALCSIYLQVTATPQAVLLQTVESKWQPLFNYYFKPGHGYLGGDFFFPQKYVPEFVRFTDDRTPLDIAKEAVLRHLVVSAQGLLSGEKVSNCLVHPGIRQAAHEKAREDIETGLSWWSFHHNDEYFEPAFKEEYNSMSPKNSEEKSYEQIREKVLEILENHLYSIVVLNGTSNDGEENYATGCNFIIGGTNLGRGVTFGQLNTFIYTRTSKNPQADTMWQHTRMFGYDRDPGLITVYCSTLLYSLFSEINETNNSIINQIQKNIKIRISYPNGIQPTRSNVMDKSVLNILTGGSNHFPLNPVNNTFARVDDLLKNFGDRDLSRRVSLSFIINVLKCIKTESTFNMDGYIELIQATLASSPLEQGYILVRRNRDISHNSRALLSPNDWQETNQYRNHYVLTMYRVLGQKNKGWNGYPIWVPNIKLPEFNNFYLI